MNEFLRRLRYYFGRRRFEAELDEEMAFHREMTGERRFGDTTRLKEESRAAWSWPTLDSTARDLRYGTRRLLRSPGFAVVAILSLALGTGANTAVFQLLNAVGFRSLPVPDAHELVEVTIDGGNQGFGRSLRSSSLTYPVWEQIRDNQRALDAAFAWAQANMQLGEGSDGRLAQGAWVSGEAFSTLGVVPFRGRLLGPADDQPGCQPRAVISHGLWQRQFGGSDAAVGSEILVRGRPVTVIGVTPPEFFGIETGRRVEAFLPFCVASAWTPGILASRDLFWIRSMGRLAPGVSAAEATAQFETASVGWFEAAAPSGYGVDWMELWDRFRLMAEPRSNGVSELREAWGTALWLLLGISALVLAIACVNLANLLLARSKARGREVGVRLALGASRARVMWQIFWESLLLAVAGAVAGVILAAFLSRTLLSFIQGQVAFVDLDLAMDWHVMVFVAVIALAVCLGLSVTTGLLATRQDRLSSVTSATRDTQSDRAGLAFQRPLITAQVAVSLVLVASSLLFARSFVNLFTLDAGFRQEGVVFHPVGPGSDEVARLRPLLGSVLDELRAAPGIEAAATSSQILLSGGSTYLVVQTAEGRSGRSEFAWVSPGYFDALAIPFRSGRDVSTLDDEGSPRVIVVNEAFVRQYLGAADPVGQIVRSVAEPGYPASEFEVVGVVADTRYFSLRQGFPPIAYASDAQPMGDNPIPPRVVTRSPLPAGEVAAMVGSAIENAVPAAEVGESVDIRARAIAGMGRERMLAWIAGFFGILAIGLAATGLYGVVSCLVEARRGEIGIRMALGATRPAVAWMVLRQVAVLTGLGLVAGAVVTIAVSGAMRSMLFGLEPTDPATLLASALILLAVGLWAGLVPARRAARVDPRATLG